MMYNMASQGATQNGSISAGTIIVLIALIVVVVLIVYRLFKNHKEGKSSCGCNCSGCGQGGCETEKMIENIQSAHLDQKKSENVLNKKEN